MKIVTRAWIMWQPTYIWANVDMWTQALESMTLVLHQIEASFVIFRIVDFHRYDTLINQTPQSLSNSSHYILHYC